MAVGKQTFKLDPETEPDLQQFSPASACNYSFKFPSTARLGDILHVELEGMTKRTDVYYSVGVN